VLDEAVRPDAAPLDAAAYADHLAAYLRARMADTLAVPPHRIARLVLRRRGTLRAAPGRLDVTIALVELPPAVRLAGLDRDPGWLPAAGRHIAFHFE
jgi:hypothetical protein